MQCEAGVYNNRRTGVMYCHQPSKKAATSDNTQLSGCASSGRLYYASRSHGSTSGLYVNGTK